MRSNIKYLTSGLFIGFAITAFMVIWVLYVTSGLKNTTVPLPSILLPSSTSTPVTPTLTPTITFTPTITPTFTPTKTQTPSPTATRSIVGQMIVDGDIIFTGPLSVEQQIKLYEVSLQYVAPTTQKAKEVGTAINGQGYGSPSLICGPLSLAILQAAGLIEDRGVIPYDFWLLNPYIPSGRTMLNRVFPTDQYESTLYKTRLDKFDWRSFPLQPGDFLYLRRGTGGNFDHMLVVTRVDSQLRPYAVTNFETANGFIIDEVILYDLANWKAGIFGKWTEKPNQLTGSTGFGGFEIWRLRAP